MCLDYRHVGCGDVELTVGVVERDVAGSAAGGVGEDLNAGRVHSA